MALQDQFRPVPCTQAAELGSHETRGKSPMQNVFSRLFAAASLSLAIAATAAAADAPKIPRTKDGKPDLNGIWQTLNSANYDLEPHAARAALAMVPGQFVPVPAPQVVALGAVGSVPAGLGVVEGDSIPYKPEALEKKKENQKNWLTLGSGDQVLPARRAACDLHAVPVPDLPEQGLHVLRLRVRRRRPQHLYEGSGAAARRFLDGSVGRPLGRRHARRRRHRLQRPDLVRPLRQLTTATNSR